MRLIATIMITALTPIATHAQTVETARAFVVNLYRPYTHGLMPDYKHETVFSPQLSNLITQDENATPAGDVGYLDGDPICDCQEANGLKVAGISVNRSAPGRVVASAILRFPSETKVITFNLTALKGQWYISDIITKASGSLLKALQQDLASKQARH